MIGAFSVWKKLDCMENTRFNPRLPRSRETQDDMDRQHKIVDWVVTDRTNKEGGRQTSMEKKIVHGVSNPRNEDG